MKSWLEKNTIEMYSIDTDEKSERSIRSLKNKVYKYMPSISKNVYFDKLVYTVHKYNKIYHRTIKMKPVDVKLIMYIDFNKENNKEDPKFIVGDNVRISKYKKIFAKGYVAN